MKQRNFYFFTLLFFVTATLTSAKNRDVQKRTSTISRITIRNYDIFDFESMPYLNKCPYTWINILHIQTKESVIAHELLFKEGDTVDPFLLRETERRLRNLSFIRSARIQEFPQRDGTTALVIYTQDAWTTEPQINLSGINGVDSIEFGFKEKNLLGYGKTIQVFYNKTPSTIEREIGYFDPQLFNSHWQLTLKNINRSFGHTRTFNLERPFFSATTKYSLKSSFLQEKLEAKEFDKNVVVSKFEQTKNTGEVSAATKIGTSNETVNHAGIRYKDQTIRYDRTSETPIDRGIPNQTEQQTLYLDLETVENKYIELTQIEKMSRVEDFNLGTTFHMSPGITPKILTGDRNSTELGSDISRNFLFRENHFFTNKLSYSSRHFFEKLENERYSLSTTYYNRHYEKQTWVIHSRLDWGYKLDPDNLVILGHDSGLRGFKQDAFVGNKSLVLNIENRIFLLDDVANLVSIGGALFYDTGYAWQKGQPVSLSKLHSDVGMGLRFGLTKSSNEVIIRLDFGYRLQRENSSDPHFVVTFGTGQAF